LFLSIFCSFSKLFLLHTLPRSNIRVYWEINYSFSGQTDSRPARNKGFIDGVDDEDADDDKIITESKKMLGKYGHVIIMQT